MKEMLKKNKLGIIGAMDEEVDMIKAKMSDIIVKEYANMKFYQGKIYDKDIIVVRSGIGKVNAAICLQILVNIFKIDKVINTGIAGSLRSEINIGDIVLSHDALQHDVDATNFGYDLAVIPRMDKSTYFADEEMLELAYNLCKRHLKKVNVYKGRILSGDQFIADNKKKAWLLETFKGHCTEMEGAAIAQAAYLNKIPFLIIRSISDKADNSAHMAYDEFESLAISNTEILIDEYLKVF